MKILVITNLFPPQHAGTYDLRCQATTEALRTRGHEMFVLTSNYGLTSEQRDSETHRRLRLNGIHGQPVVKEFRELQELEAHNHRVFWDAAEQFQPDLIHVWSLHGLSKSLILAFRAARRPCVFDVADHWLSQEMRDDPWLHWWNCEPAPFTHNVMRRSLELSGQRSRIDVGTPTRCQPGIDRLPEVFGGEKRVPVAPDSIGHFHFKRLYFSSHSLKQGAVQAGFRVSHGEVIYPGVPTGRFMGDVKPSDQRVKKFVIVADMNRQSGVATALHAIERLRQQKPDVSLDVYGRGESDHMAQLRSQVVGRALPVNFQTVSNLTKDLPAIFRQHDAYLHTVEWDEPFNTTFVEAMACGLPVITTTSGAMREIVRHGESALVCAPGDAEELAECMKTLCDDGALRRKLAEAGQEEALAKFNETTTVDQIENYLRETCDIWQMA
jgi:glycosyltransferase involved in cell wall biosynthesis